MTASFTVGRTVTITTDSRKGKPARVVKAASDGRSGWVTVQGEVGRFFYTDDEIA